MLILDVSTIAINFVLPAEDSAKTTSKYRKTYCRVRGEISRILELFYPSIVVIPAGIGGHIDHVTVRNVVLMLCKNTDIQIVLYEDFPYCLDENTYRLSTEFIQSLGAIPRVLSIKKYWLEKIINILEYKSQFDGDELQFLSQLFHYAPPFCYSVVNPFS